MKKSKKVNVLRLITRILAGFVLVFALPFYFGYGNPLPFIDSSYTAWDNLWLSVFPFVFIGLLVGFKFEKIGGYLVSIPLVLGLLGGFILEGEFIWFMTLPLFVGLLYLYLAYQKK